MADVLNAAYIHHQESGNMKVIQIKGANGSGKSTIMYQLIQASGDAQIKDLGNYQLTILDTLHMVLVGKYDGKLTSNGCDHIKTVQEMKNAIVNALALYPGYDVIFEGMLISTIKSTFYNFLLQLEKERGIDGGRGWKLYRRHGN